MRTQCSLLYPTMQTRETTWCSRPTWMYTKWKEFQETRVSSASASVSGRQTDRETSGKWPTCASLLVQATQKSDVWLSIATSSSSKRHHRDCIQHYMYHSGGRPEVLTAQLDHRYNIISPPPTHRKTRNKANFRLLVVFLCFFQLTIVTDHKSWKASSFFILSNVDY